MKRQFKINLRKGKECLFEWHFALLAGKFKNL